MKKQLEFTTAEHKIITNSLMKINEILLSKMDEGIKEPILDGTQTVDNEDKEVIFSFTARKKSS